MVKIYLVILISSVIALTACSEEATVSTDATIVAGSVSELEIIDVVVGEGKQIQNNHRVAVHYTGWLYDENAKDKKGSKFDSSFDRNRPFVFSIGNHDVIQGWEEGLLGMQIGGKRTLIIPASKGYGSKGAGGLIPPNAALIFDIELLQAG